MSRTIHSIVEHFHADLDERKLTLHLSLLQDIVKDSLDSTDNLQLTDVITAVKKLGPRLCSEVVKLIGLLLVIPATPATAERSFSALRRLKTYLRTSMTQQRLNNLLVSHVHREETDAIDMISVAQQFIAKGDNRYTIFGQF